MSAVLSFFAIRLARLIGLTSKPGADRWSNKETPLFGGAAILVAFLVAYLIFGQLAGRMIYIIATACFLFSIGLYDDLRGLSPSMKLIAQIAGACLLIYGGVYVNIWFPVIGIPLSILWFVGMSNAVNLLDNMDGVAAGVCAISAAVLAFHAISSDYPEIALAGASLSGACVGFVFFNFHPAKIFMGDSGSLFLGMTLGALGVTATYREAANILVTLFVPMLILGVPLFDTMLVSILRKGHGRSITTGGKDHSAHRLVSLGFSERKTALLFYVICIVLGVASVFAKTGILVMLLISGVTGAAVLLGAFLLGGVKTYEVTDEESERTMTAKIFKKYRRIAGLVIFDMFVITGSYVASYFIRFDWQIPDYLEKRITYVLPVIIVLKLFILMLYKVYKIDWKNIERSDLWRLFKAVSGGSVLSLLTIALESQFKLFLISILIIDWLLCLVIMSTARLLLPIIVAGKSSQ